MPKKIVTSRLFALILLVTIFCYQLPAFGTAGLGETILRTPDGQSFGGDTGASEATILGGNQFRQYGFYDDDGNGRYIVGQAKTGEFKIYDRVKKETISFASKQKICAYVKAKGLKFNSNIQDRNVRSLVNIASPLFAHLDFFIILFSLYAVVPLLAILFIYTRFNKHLPLSQRTDRALNDNRFKLIIICLSVLLNIKLFNNYDSDINFIFTCVMWLPLMQYLSWKLAVFISNLSIDTKRSHQDSNSIAYLNTFIFLGVLMLFLAFTVGSCQAPSTSIQYFYCG